MVGFLSKGACVGQHKPNVRQNQCKLHCLNRKKKEFAVRIRGTCSWLSKFHRFDTLATALEIGAHRSVIYVTLWLEWVQGATFCPSREPCGELSTFYGGGESWTCVPKVLSSRDCTWDSTLYSMLALVLQACCLKPLMRHIHLQDSWLPKFYIR